MSKAIGRSTLPTDRESRELVAALVGGAPCARLGTPPTPLPRVSSRCEATAACTRAAGYQKGSRLAAADAAARVAWAETDRRAASLGRRAGSSGSTWQRRITGRLRSSSRDGDARAQDD